MYLAHSHAHGQGAGNVFLRVDPGELRHGLLDHTHLGAVSVGDDHLVSVCDQVHNDLCRLPDRMILLGQIVTQGVAAKATTMRWDMVMPAFLKWRCPATREKNVPPDMRCAQCRGFFLQGHCIRNIQKCKKNFHSKCPQRGDIPGATHSLHTVRQIWALVFWWGRGYTGVKTDGRS